ncbi:MAG: response regulator transcription factor [Sphingobacteriia bacterium]|nr:response regulator transcription factor [Sphingobacteriia bacterium]
MDEAEKNRILLADDEPQNLRSLFEALASEKYQIYTAPNGAVAFEQALKYLPNAIIMDWDMPGISGIEAVRRLREQPQTKNIPIIMATGKMTSVENLKAALDAGANDYIRKPFDTVEIIARVKSMIRFYLEYKKNIKLQQQVAGREIANLKYELEMNTSALTVAKLRLIESGQNTLQLISDLEKLRKCDSETGEAIITKIISYCRANNFKVNWMEFETLFQKVHPAFYTQLQEAFPDLTKNERKICALIKLNLATKEISAIMNKEKNTVKKAKHRLKSKLELKNMDSLYHFVQEIN